MVLPQSQPAGDFRYVLISLYLSFQQSAQQALPSHKGSGLLAKGIDRPLGCHTQLRFLTAEAHHTAFFRQNRYFLIGLPHAEQAAPGDCRRRKMLRQQPHRKDADVLLCHGALCPRKDTYILPQLVAANVPVKSLQVHLFQQICEFHSSLPLPRRDECV